MRVMSRTNQNHPYTAKLLTDIRQNRQNQYSNIERPDVIWRTMAHFAENDFAAREHLNCHTRKAPQVRSDADSFGRDVPKYAGPFALLYAIIHGYAT